jgi:predicted secreted protein
MYAKVLGLQYLRPSNLLCFAFFEGAVVLAALLALAELADWWVVLVLPLTVAAMVKLNDVIAGAVQRAASNQAPKALGRAAVPGAALRGAAAVSGTGARGWPRRGTRIPSSVRTDDSVAPTGPAGSGEWSGSPEQRARQSATRRYE